MRYSKIAPPPPGDWQVINREEMRGIGYRPGYFRRAWGEETVDGALTMKSLREQFRSLSKREQDILGRSFGALGYTKTDLREIAIRNRLREDGVEKAKKQALKKLREWCLDSMAWKLRRARHMVDHAITLEQQL